MQIVQKIYLNTDYLEVVTRNLAIQNPQTGNINVNQFKIKYYSWEKISISNVSTGGASPYMLLDSTNLNSSPLNFNK